MNKQNLLLKKTDREYEEYINGKRNQTPDEIIANAEEIAGIKLMYDTVKAETFSEEECEYLLTLRKPLQTMYLHYEMDEGLYDSIGRTVAMMADNNISDYRVLDKEDFKTRIIQKLETIYGEYYMGIRQPESVEEASRMTGVISTIRSPEYNISDYIGEVLLQFKNPLYVLVQMQNGIPKNCIDCFDESIIKLFNSDILELPYELDEDNVMQDTYDRHKALGEAEKLLPDMPKETILKWLYVIRESAVEMEKPEERKANPYQYFIDNIIAIKNRYGSDIAADVCSLKNEHKYMTEDNMIPAAQYIEKFGEDDRLGRLIEDEELEDFMEQKQDGMDLC